MNFLSWLTPDSYWSAATLGWFLALLVTGVIMEWSSTRIRRSEGYARQTTTPEDEMVRWLSRIRYDIAVVVIGLGIANSLLGAILGVLLFRRCTAALDRRRPA
jgi:hypothetical protein